MDKTRRIIKFYLRLYKKYDENGDIGYFLEADIEYVKELFNFHEGLPFLPERKKVNEVERLICSTEN